MSKSKRKSKSIESELMPDEEILWQGHPILSKLFTSQDVILIPFSIVWCFITIPMLISGFLEGNWLFIILPHGWVGLYLLFGRFIHKIIRKQHTTYVLTNNRVLILNNLFGKHVQAFQLNRLPSLEKVVGRGGVGNVIFAEPTQQPWWRGSRASDLREFGGNVPGFYDIQDVEEVHRMIAELSYTPMKVEKRKPVWLPR